MKPNKNELNTSKNSDNYYLEEWKECRNAIAQYGKFVLDIRKYGFTIITGMLSANAFLFVKLLGLSPWEKCTLSFIICLLIFGLFISDRYYMVLIRATVRRAIKIERFLPTNLTLFIHKYVKRTQIDSHIIFLYILFIFASVIPSFVTVFTNDFPDTLSKVIFFIVCLSILIGFIGWIIYYNSKSILDINIDLQAEKNKLAKKYEDDGDEDRAIKCYEENVEENYEAYDHFDRLAKIYKKKRDKVNQIRVLKRAIWVYENIVFKYHIDREKILKEFEKRLKRVNLES